VTCHAVHVSRFTFYVSHLLGEIDYDYKELFMSPPPDLTTDQIRAFVLAGHGDLDRVKELLASEPALLNVAHEWSDSDHETALQGAAHVGNSAIAEFLLGKGAPLDICTAAMLGRQAEVEHFVADDPSQIYTNGAHGIPLLAHAAYSGDVALVQWLMEHDARTGVSAALFNAVNRHNETLTRWLLLNGNPDLSWQNFQGKTALMIATEHAWAPGVQLLSGAD
jgi:uncharacterized protein